MKQSIFIQNYGDDNTDFLAIKNDASTFHNTGPGGAIVEDGNQIGVCLGVWNGVDDPTVRQTDELELTGKIVVEVDGVVVPYFFAPEHLPIFFHPENETKIVFKEPPVKPWDIKFTIGGVTTEYSTGPSIPDNLFVELRNKGFNLSDATELIINDTVTHIGQSAFYGLFLNTPSVVERVTIPNSVKSMDLYAFREMRVKHIVIGSGMETVGPRVFDDTQRIETYTYLSLTPPVVEDASFAGITTTSKIFVPAESLELYQNAPVWSTMTRYINPIV